MMFSPICKNVCQSLCTLLNVDFEKTNVPLFTRVGLLGAPCKNDSIVADGNCFFRAISQAVTGTQKYHRKIRVAVVQQLEKNSVKYQNILRTEYSSMSEYINKSKMRYVNIWATEVEIQATADYLGVNVFTFFDGRWLKYTCNSKLLSNQSIYLENCNGNHYETVVCVYEPELQSCYGYCKTSESYITGYNIRSHIKNDNNVLALENQKLHFEVQMQSRTEQQHNILKTVQNETGAAGMIVDCDVEVVGDSDVEIVENAGHMTFKYSPVSTEVAQTICNELNLNFEREYIQVSRRF
ncbi:OTU domain-containing protein 4-like [Sinocyclocheilus rhinocerous]|uniref:OTU domain-containing protein 4-like n=1 Tax=Sinocyclocheilus rhinocerous TaxID=307959 RepID=UPI0007BACE6E|nr:PREDICTED: OTU domain-containing protein 4-like [Sinocyclocheilus rhinocerous]